MKLSRKRVLKKIRRKKFSRKKRVQSGGFVGTFYNLAMMPLKIAGTVMTTVFTGVKSLVDKPNNKPQEQAPMNNVAPMNSNSNSIMIDNNTKSIIESNNNNIDTLKKMLKFKQIVNSAGENMDIVHPIQSLQVVKLH